MNKKIKIKEKQKFSTSKEESLFGDVLAANCPSRLILNNVTSKWGVLIFFVLSGKKTKRFSEIRREIDGISEKMLTQTLKTLEEDQFVIRKSYNVVPPYVEYSLSQTGEEIAKKVIGLIEWIEANLPRIQESKN